MSYWSWARAGRALLLVQKHIRWVVGQVNGPDWSDSIATFNKITLDSFSPPPSRGEPRQQNFPTCLGHGGGGGSGLSRFRFHYHCYKLYVGQRSWPKVCFSNWWIKEIDGHDDHWKWFSWRTKQSRQGRDYATRLTIMTMLMIMIMMSSIAISSATEKLQRCLLQSSSGSHVASDKFSISYSYASRWSVLRRMVLSCLNANKS